MNIVALGVVIVAGALLFALSTLQKKSLPKLRSVPALGRLYRAVGMSVEGGTRLLISLGDPSLLTGGAGAPLAGLAMLRHLAERTSLSDRPPVAVAGEAPLAILAMASLLAGLGIIAWQRSPHVLARHWQAQLGTAPDEEVDSLLRQLAQLGEPGIQVLVKSLGSDRHRVAQGARDVIWEEIAGWESLRPDEASARAVTQ